MIHGYLFYDTCYPVVDDEGVCTGEVWDGNPDTGSYDLCDWDDKLEELRFGDNCSMGASRVYGKVQV